MPIAIPSGLQLEFASLEQDTLLDLYEIDLSTQTNAKGIQGGIIRLVNQTNEKGGAIVWQGVEYTPYPIEGDGYEVKANGTSPRPKLKVSNLFGLVTGMIKEFNDCLGCKVTRRQVYAKHLDPVNFKTGVNAKHNRNNEIVSYYIIEQVGALTKESVSFTMALPCETDKLFLPSRTMLPDTCQFVYRSVECGYTGTAKFTDKDQPTNDSKMDRCSKCLNGCKIRGNSKNFGAFIAINNL